MGVEVWTDQEAIASTNFCRIDNSAPTTAQGTNTKSVQAESFVDAGFDVDVQVEETDSTIDTDDTSPESQAVPGNVLAFQASGATSLGAELVLMTGYSEPTDDDISIERNYDGTPSAGAIPVNADIFKSRTDAEATLVTFTIKTREEFGIADDAILKDIEFDVNQTSGTMFFGLLNNDFSPTNATWNSPDGSSSWNPRWMGGSKAQEKVYKTYVTSTAETVSLKPFIAAYGLDFGSKINLGIWKNGTTITKSADTRVTLNTLNYRVQFEDPSPTVPQISIEANDDGLTWWDQRTGSEQTATINVVNGLDDEDLTQLYLTTTTSSTDGTFASAALDAYNDNSGPHLTTEEIGRRQFNTKELSNPGLVTVAGPSKGDNLFWYYRMFVEDANNTTSNATASNVVKAVRPTISSALSYNKEGTQTSTFEVGDLVEIKVESDSTFTTSRHHAGGPAKGKIKKVYVNWNASTPAFFKTSGGAYQSISLGADLAASATTLQVGQQHGLDGYIYEAGVNEVYIVLNTESDSAVGVPERLEIIKVIEKKGGGTDYQYTVERAKFGTPDVAHESGLAASMNTTTQIYVYSPAKIPQRSLFNVGNVENINNYVEYELPSPSSTTDGSIVLTHRYGVDEEVLGNVETSAAGSVYKEQQTIRVVVEDEYGWRSQAASIEIKNTPVSPEASISASRGETALASTAGDRESAVVLSGTNSRAFGAGKTIKHYKWTCTQEAAGDIVTSGVLDINNEALEPASRKLYARCNKDGYTSAVITVVGLASFDADGTSIADDVGGFNDGYYKYVKATVSPGDTGYTTAAGAGSSWAAPAVSSGEIYFKQVDFAYLTTVDGTASASEIYQIFSSDEDGTEPTAHDKSRCVVPKLCVDTDQTIWGGLTTIAATAGSGGTTGYGARIKANVSNQRFESVAAGGHENFITDGFAPGDFIIVKGGFTSANQGMYLIDKVELSSGTYHMYVDTSFKKIDSTETVTQTTKKEMYVTKPSISLACESDATETFNLIATDTADADSPTALVNIPFKVPASLDLDAAHNAGNISIQSTQITRKATLNANMPIGMRRYPVGTMHTKYGLPTLTMSVRVMDDTGFAYLTQLIDNRYSFAKYAYNKITSSETTYVTYKLKLQSWALNKKPEQQSHEVYNLTFVIAGESI